MGGKRNAQQKTTSRATKGKLLKSKAPRVTCSCCNETRAISETVSPLRIELEMLKAAPPRFIFETGWSVLAAQSGSLIWACETCLRTGRALEAKPLLQSYGYGHPKFAYFDQFQTCSDCGQEFIFSASEQTFWYETLEFPSFSTPRQCPNCRRKRRAVKKANTKLSEMLASFEGTIPELLHAADLYEQMGNKPKSLEFLRRAKNKSRDEAEKQVLVERIAVVEG